MYRKLLPLFFMATAPLLAFSSSAQEKMIADLDVIKNTFEAKYAPFEWKYTYAGWNLEAQMDLAKAKVLENGPISIYEYHHIVREFFNSTRDYHVGVQFYSTELAVLPFRMHSAQGKYYIAWTYTPYLSELEIPLEKGDEVILFNGLPIDAALQEFKLAELGNPESATDQALAEALFTLRTGSSGMRVPQGPVMITVRHASNHMMATYQLDWVYNAEEISDPFANQSKKDFGTLLCQHSFFYKNMTAPFFKSYKNGLTKRERLFHSMQDSDEEDDLFVGSEKSFLPPLGRILWTPEDENAFDAYLYSTPAGKKIGFIRIPHYMGSDKAAEDFATILRYFQANSDALVIDQLNNPGGSLFYMYALASMLTDKPLLLPKNQMTITQEDIAFAVDYIELFESVQNNEDAVDLFGASSIQGYPVDYSLVQDFIRYFQFMLQEWNAGRLLTRPGFIEGIETLKPHPDVNYTKPILLLVNALDFSCGDFLPAILQDNKRVTIMGRQTAGAGGYVLGHSYPNSLGIAGFSFTGSIAQRIDLNPIENLGVTPDRKVEMTPNDLEHGYRDYVREIHKAVTDIMKP